MTGEELPLASTARSPARLPVYGELGPATAVDRAQADVYRVRQRWGR